MPDMSTGSIEALARALQELDPEGEYVSLDIANRHVRYSPRIKQHETIGDFVGDEELVRAYFIAWLCTRGAYPPESLELERRYEFGRGSALELDIRISLTGKPDQPYSLIELKSPADFRGETDSRIGGQLFSPAGQEPDCKLLSMVTVLVGPEGQPTIKAVTIEYNPNLTYERWLQAGRPHVDDFPINYNEAIHQPYIPGSERDLRTTVDLADLDRLRRQLHDRLWGGSRDDNQIYAWLVRLFLTKIHDEKVTNEGEPYVFQVFHIGSRKESAVETLSRVGARYEEAHRRYISPSFERVEPLDQALFSAAETQWVVELLQGISLTAAGRSNGDVLGAFFEGITRDGFKQSKGLFFTHYNLAVFMLEVLQIGQLAEAKLISSAHPNERLPYIIDPSCGSGTFLLAAMRSVSSHIESRKNSLRRNRDVREQLQMRFPNDAPNTWAKDFIYGIEKREDLAISTKVNMVLHRDGHTHVFNDDGLAPLNDVANRHNEEKLRAHSDPDGLYEKPVAETFDVVLTNPPFSITLDGSVRARLGSTFDLASDRNSENLFLERWYQLLKPGGRLAAVLPESFFSTAENIKARLFLFEHFHVRAIVTLPPHAFQPWTPTRTSLLFAQKKNAPEEAAWIDVFRRHRMAVEVARTSVIASARAIQRPGRRRTVEQLAHHVDTVKQGLLDLRAGTLMAISGTEEWAAEAVAVATAISADSVAFERSVNDLPQDGYVGVTVSEVGYRRTKRAENDKRNDLFAAEVDVEEDGQQSTKVLRNLNDAPDGWRIIISDENKDALSVLRKEQLWH